jgi:DNA (cytosine-5)-methyltransferase 1
MAKDRREIRPLPKIVSLFSGAGGLDLGFKSAGFPVVLAIDNSSAAIKTHQRNFPATSSIAADLIELGPDGVIRLLQPMLSSSERIGVVGGPPCQGFSRANNGSFAGDPRNSLALLYLDVVKALQESFNLEFVLFENVVGIRDRKHSDIFAEILIRFEGLGLHWSVDEHCALDFGVPQTRNRVVISAFESLSAAAAFSPKKVPRGDLTVRSAIDGLPQPVFFERGLDPKAIHYHPNHWTMRPMSPRFNESHGTQQVSRSFRRLRWDSPSPTVAYGHREIHVHPEGKRRLSIYEAMMLQGFPKKFVIEGTLSEQVEQVSNAVPPPLAKALAMATKVALKVAQVQTDADDNSARRPVRVRSGRFADAAG